MYEVNNSQNIYELVCSINDNYEENKLKLTNFHSYIEF